MTVATLASPCVDIESSLFKLYRSYFDRAEKKRRWSLTEDIPWSDCNTNLDPAVADLVETFCLVEMHLPDYVANAMRAFRASRACSWFYANWGYEESKHSLALADWLLRSGARTESQMADLECNVFQREWNLPHDNHLGMLVYAMVQELATWLNYRNLRRHAVGQNGDPALDVLLRYVSVDERAHFDFFRHCVQLYLDHDREATVEQLRRVLSNFAMPAIYDLADSRRRIEQIRRLQIFDEEQYFREVYMPVLESLGVNRREIRDRVPIKKSAVDAVAR